MPDEVFSIMGGEATVDITLNRANANVAVGSTITLKATTKPVGDVVAWSSSANSTASVSDGVVTGVATGVATITASVTKGGTTYSDTCKVTVVAAY